MSEKNNAPENKIVKSYKGFDLISSKYVPDCNSTAVYLKHRKTGLEVFHLLNNDEENLFAFSFRTPIKNATGAAHILEHSVLCGSEKFPLKEPFTNMMNQSVNTFLNAMTYPDKTIYPASSMVRPDYFNIFDVYADAVFFPLLKKETFIQEAHRVEIDEKGKTSIQGVVYNEMKGAYSDFDSVANDIQFRSLLKDSNYSFDSGGDPLDIPSFTYEDFKAFHKKYYRPDNCLLFLYGNIPTEEQLDFIQEKVLDRIEKKECPSQEEILALQKEIMDIETVSKPEGPVHVNGIAPDEGASGSTVSVSWLCGETKDIDSVMELAFLGEILCGHDGSPVSKVLTESAMGDGVISGVISESRYFTYCLGLHGVQKKNVTKVYNLVENTLEKISKEGVRKSDMEAAILSAEFANREVVRVNGPYSLMLLDRVLASWNYSNDPYPALFFKDNFDKVRKNAESDPDYVKKLIKKYLLDNKKKSYVQVDPSPKFLKEREEKESLLLKEIEKTLDKENAKKELDELHAYQQHKETPLEVSCIPSLKISDLDVNLEKINTKINTKKSNASGISPERREVPLVLNEEDTNGIVYFEVYFPLDAFKAEEYKYLPLFSNFVSSTGWKGLSWSECSDLAGVCSAGVGSRLITGSIMETPESRKLVEENRKYNIVGRDYIIFETKFLIEDAKRALELFGDFITGYEFADDKHMTTILEESKNEIKSCVVPKGNRFALRRAAIPYNHSTMVDEIWRGLTQVFAMQEISSMKIADIKAKFLSYKKRIFDSGCFIHVTCDTDSMKQMNDCLGDFVDRNGFSSPSEPSLYDDGLFLKETLLPGEKETEASEYFPIKSQVGYAMTVFDASVYGSKECAVEKVIAHWLSGTYMWERIRTTGGAYGATAGSIPSDKMFYFGTYRDPSPEKSSELFAEILEDAAKAELEDDEMIRLITGTYGDLIQPRSPYGKGAAGVVRFIYAVSDEDRCNIIKHLVQVTKDDVSKGSARLCENIKKRRSIILGEKPEKNTGVIVQLPL